VIMKRLELAVESLILASRWLLVIFYFGLVVALLLYGVSFGGKLLDFLSKVTSIGEAEAILKMLGLIDAALVASLVVMVIISGYENYVSRFDNEAELHWLGKIDTGSLKIKVASTIVAISSIHLAADLPQRRQLHLRATALVHADPPRLRHLRALPRPH